MRFNWGGCRVVTQAKGQGCRVDCHLGVLGCGIGFHFPDGPTAPSGALTNGQLLRLLDAALIPHASTSSSSDLSDASRMAGDCSAAARECRELMEEFLRWAENASSKVERDDLLEVADAWRKAVLKLERMLGLVA